VTFLRAPRPAAGTTGRDLHNASCNRERHVEDDSYHSLTLVASGGPMLLYAVDWWHGPYPPAHPAQRSPEHLEDWQVLDDGKPIGRIYEKHAPASPTRRGSGRSPSSSSHAPGLRTSGSAETFDAARVAYRECWDKWRAWAAQAGFDSGSG
jgi:hypothetical protein